MASPSCEFGRGGPALEHSAEELWDASGGLTRVSEVAPFLPSDADVEAIGTVFISQKSRDNNARFRMKDV